MPARISPRKVRTRFGATLSERCDGATTLRLQRIRTTELRQSLKEFLGADALMNAVKPARPDDPS